MSIKPVAYRHRWFDSSPHTSTSGQWYPWEYCDENKYREILAYIEGGYKYEAEMLYAIPDTHRVVPVDALNRIMELAGVALVYQPFGTKDRQHFDALMAIIEDKP